ncbi:extracellular metalloproteinase 9 [Batrachochytrium salamandrivorans]|nr:extracellular metalloproteinase 9 [Batrachochytrium salamandrivorans]
MMRVKCGHLCFGKSTGILLSSTDFQANLYDASQSAGNIVTMKIIIGGMMLQSCNPTLISARNAILDADVNHYDGVNRCEIYKGFAKRGLGLGATGSYSNDFSVPPECQ